MRLPDKNLSYHGGAARSAWAQQVIRVVIVVVINWAPSQGRTKSRRVSLIRGRLREAGVE